MLLDTFIYWISAHRVQREKLSINQKTTVKELSIPEVLQDGGHQDISLFRTEFTTEKQRVL